MGLAEFKRIVIADDHAPTRASLRAALALGGLLVVGEASDAANAVTLVNKELPDVALLDVRMPGSGIAAAAKIADDCPNTAVVMLTVSENDEDLFAALRVGARGYLLKGGDPAELPGLLERVLAGEALLHGSLLARVVGEFRERERERLFSHRPRVRLSNRERDVLDRLESGATTAEIAADLFISQVTVRSHVAAICRKLKLPDRQAVIRELSSHGVQTVENSEGARDTELKAKRSSATSDGQGEV
jgi:two-component system, NarL family, nitrate/nitrite response regulator NarL